MLKILTAPILAAALLLLGGCNTMKVEEISQPSPELKIEQFFDGKVYAWGLFEDRFGQIRRQFIVEIDGNWDGETLTLDENFLYADGEKDQRIWTIKKEQHGIYSGSAADIVGHASGDSTGNTLNWFYTLDLKVGDGTWRVNFDDYMILQPGGVLMNRAYVKKWGFTIGSVTLSFIRGDQLTKPPFEIAAP